MVKAGILVISTLPRLPSSIDILKIDSLRARKTVHEPVIPRNPIPRERGSGRPPLTDLNSTELNTTPDNLEELDTTPQNSEFTDEDLNLLVSNNVYRSPQSARQPVAKLHLCFIPPHHPNVAIDLAFKGTPRRSAATATSSIAMMQRAT